jgi:hypothetical protein
VLLCLCCCVDILLKNLTVPLFPLSIEFVSGSPLLLILSYFVIFFQNFKWLILFHGRDENEEGDENKVERKRNWVESVIGLYFVEKEQGRWEWKRWLGVRGVCYYYRLHINLTTCE